MKYNLSKIMRRAWTLKKRYEMFNEDKALFSECLKEAWKAEKSTYSKKVCEGQLKGSEKQIKWAEDIREYIVNVYFNELIKMNMLTARRTWEYSREKVAQDFITNKVLDAKSFINLCYESEYNEIKKYEKIGEDRDESDNLKYRRALHGFFNKVYDAICYDAAGTEEKFKLALNDVRIAWNNYRNKKTV